MNPSSNASACPPKADTAQPPASTQSTMGKRVFSIALAAIFALGLAACTPTPNGSVAAHSETSRFEQAVTLPTDIMHISDIAYTSDGGVLMAANTTDWNTIAVFAKTADGSWEALFDTSTLAASLDDDTSIGAACLTPQGSLLCTTLTAEGDGGGCYLVDPGSQSEASLPAGRITIMRSFDEGTVVASDWTGSFFRADYTTGDTVCTYRLPSGTVLADFTVHGNRVYASASKSSSANPTCEPYVFDYDTGEQVNLDAREESVLAAAFPPADASAVATPIWAASESGLFLCSTGAIYDCSGETATVLASGNATNLSNTGKTPERLLVGSGSDDIAVLYRERSGSANPYTLYRYPQGEQPKSTSSLSVYTLEDSSVIQQAAATYRDEHPEIAIEVRVGIPAGSGLSADDALRTLNAEILSGTGPDVIVLDGLPFDGFAEQGTLLDLSDIIQDARETGDEYFENVVGAFATDDGCFAIPSRFGIPAIVGSAEAIDCAQSLESLTSYIESESESPTGTDATFSVASLYTASYRSIFDTGGSVDRDALAAFFACSKRLLMLNDGRNCENAPTGYDYLGSQLDDLQGGGSGISGSGILFAENPDQQFIEIASLLSGTSFGSASLAVENASFACALEPLSFSPERVFVPSSILAVNANTPETGQAKDFVSYVLSKPQQKQDSFDIGLAVNKTAFKEAQIELGGYGMSVMGDRGSELSSVSRGAFTEAEVEANCALVESATHACMPDKTASDILSTGLLAYCRGEATLDEALDAAIQKIDLYLAQ